MTEPKLEMVLAVAEMMEARGFPLCAAALREVVAELRQLVVTAETLETENQALAEDAGGDPPSRTEVFEAMKRKAEAATA